MQPVLLLALCASMAQAQTAPTISFEGKSIRFGKNEQPYYAGPAAMVPLKPVCRRIGAEFKQSKDRARWTIRRGSDLILYAEWDSSYTFNGARRRLFVPPEQKGAAIFVPFEMLSTISGGSLLLDSPFDGPRSVEVYFRDRLVRFKRGNEPFRSDGVIFVSIRPVCAAIGARLSESQDRIRLTITRSLDKIVYDQGLHWYMFNGAQRSLRSESLLRNNVQYVPIDLFQSLVGDEIRGR